MQNLLELYPNMSQLWLHLPLSHSPSSRVLSQIIPSSKLDFNISRKGREGLEETPETCTEVGEMQSTAPAGDRAAGVRSKPLTGSSTPGPGLGHRLPLQRPPGPHGSGLGAAPDSVGPASSPAEGRAPHPRRLPGGLRVQQPRQSLALFICLHLKKSSFLLPIHFIELNCILF